MITIERRRVFWELSDFVPGNMFLADKKSLAQAIGEILVRDSVNPISGYSD